VDCVASALARLLEPAVIGGSVETGPETWRMRVSISQLQEIRLFAIQHDRASGSAGTANTTKIRRTARALAAFVVAASAQFHSTSSAHATPASERAVERQSIQVGPQREVTTIGAAAALARAGAVIHVDAGDYVGDTAVWSHNDVSLKAVGGRVRLIANGNSAEGKGIWVVRAERMTVEGFDFTGAMVRDRNGAGIRLERGSLRVSDCSFMRNENGILTSNQPDIVLEIENSEFGYNGANDGQSHNLYVGAIARLSVTGSYFHHALRGHLLKSRAATNFVSYNRLTEERDGRASYELEFPNGGVSYVIGNIIQQSPATENPHLVSVGAEGYKWPHNALYLVSNTLIDNRQSNGIFLRVNPGGISVKVINNLLVGKAILDIGVAAVFRNNANVDIADFANLAEGDFRLNADSRVVGRIGDAGTANGVSLQPSREYLHPARSVALQAPPTQLGAVQALKSKR
jgi:hypothetical protein